MTYALRITEETLPFIIDFALERQYDLSYAHDDMIYASDYGATVYVVADNIDDPDHFTITTMWEIDFLRFWKFAAPEHPYDFTEVIHL